MSRILKQLRALDHERALDKWIDQQQRKMFLLDQFQRKKDYESYLRTHFSLPPGSEVTYDVETKDGVTLERVTFTMPVNLYGKNYRK